MRGALTIGRIDHIPIRVHWSMVFLALIAFPPGMTRAEIGDEFAWLVILFACVLVHELGHSVLARHRGYVVRDIVLLPIGGVSEIIGLSDSPADELSISIVGPLTSLAISLACFGAAAGLHLELLPPTIFGRALLVRVAWANLLLGGFNLLPAIPLDGGRALRGLLAEHQDRVRATDTAASLASALAVAMTVIGLFVDLWLILIGVLLFLGARAERAGALVGSVLTGSRVAEVTVPDRSGFSASEPIGDASDFLVRFATRSFPVVEAGRVRGIVNASDLARHPHARTLGEAADAIAPVLDVDDALYPHALDAFAEAGRDALVVVDHGALAGICYRADVERLARERLERRGGSSRR